MDITKKIAEGILSCFKEANGVVTFDKVKPMIDEQIHEILKDLQEYYNNNDNEEYAADSKCAEESFYGGILSRLAPSGDIFDLLKIRTINYVGDLKNILYLFQDLKDVKYKKNIIMPLINDVKETAILTTEMIGYLRYAISLHSEKERLSDEAQALQTKARHVIDRMLENKNSIENLKKINTEDQYELNKNITIYNAEVEGQDVLFIVFRKKVKDLIFDEEDVNDDRLTFRHNDMELQITFSPKEGWGYYEVDIATMSTFQNIYGDTLSEAVKKGVNVIAIIRDVKNGAIIEINNDKQNRFLLNCYSSLDPEYYSGQFNATISLKRNGTIIKEEFFGDVAGSKMDEE